MKDNQKRPLLVELTPAEAAVINGGKKGRGADDPPGDDRGDHGPGHP